MNSSLSLEPPPNLPVLARAEILAVRNVVELPRPTKPAALQLHAAPQSELGAVDGLYAYAVRATNPGFRQEALALIVLAIASVMVIVISYLR